MEGLIIMESLNNEQREVVESTADKILCIASPGSGKTRVVCARVEHLVNMCGVGIHNIAVITYTNAAASELVKRLSTILEVKHIGFCGTLHAFCLQLIRKNCKLIGLPEKLTVIDEDQREDLIVMIMEEMGVKCSMKKVEPFLIGLVPKFQTCKEAIVASEYYKRLRKSGLLDFDTILTFGKEVIDRLKQKGIQVAEHLLVDEVQDSGLNDWCIYDAIQCCKLFVGDPDQSLYKFRGAEPEMFVRRASSKYDWSGNPWTVYKLNKNYRSMAAVIENANNLIKNNRNRVCKEMELTRQGFGLVNWSMYPDPQQEMDFVLSKIESLSIAGTAQTEFAVLARTNHTASLFAEHLKRHGVQVAFKKAAETPKDWKRTKLLLSVLENPWNDLLAVQFLKMEKGKPFGEASKVKAAKLMISVNEYLAYVFGRGEGVQGIGLASTKFDVSMESKEKVTSAIGVLNSRHGICNWTYSDLLLALGDVEQEISGTGVYVGTVHGFKGREARVVFVVSCEEGEFPKLNTDANIEEERRIMYVAMTRAKDMLYLTRCTKRQQNRGPKVSPGPFEERIQSRFIIEMMSVKS